MDEKKKNDEQCIMDENAEKVSSSEMEEVVSESKCEQFEKETDGEAEKHEDEEFEEIAENDLNSTINELKEDNMKLANENQRLQNEMDTLKDRLMRITAEYDNFRKRTSKEKEGIYTDACEDVLKNIFPVIDNLERAAVTEGDLEDIRKGIEMTLRQFKDALSKLEVEEISIDGGFDPNFHNAVMHVEDDKYDENQVVEVFQKGYKRANKVLRYSMVKVAN